MTNPLIDDRLVDLVLWDVVDAARLTDLPRFQDHSRETFELYLGSCRRLAREVLFPTYREMDEAGAQLVDGRVKLHPKMRDAYAQIRELGVIAATRPEAVGGASLPATIATMAHAYLQAGNLSPTALCGLTTGAAHLIEAFGDEALKETFALPMYEGRWTGTMALTEPQAGSSLADITARATLAADGTYRIEGSKIFISGGDQDVTENVVHLTLARIDGAPPGTRGISLFAVPRLRPEGGALVDNDVEVSGLIHKIGWRALPSLALAYGSRGDCHGWLVGEPHRGLPQMFQMMNEARLMIGVQGAATASVAYHESLAYARERTQGRALTTRDPASPPVPLVEHADVRRMLLRQKAIVDGSLCLAAVTARLADDAEHGDARAQLLLDLLTPVTKSFPAEQGYESNVLALQIHGGYGYSSEYLPEAWLRDQKLNSIHEGTTGIQGLDLLGRKVVAKGGAALAAFSAAVREDLDRSALDVGGVRAALDRVGALTASLGARGLSGDVAGMLAHSADYLALTSIVVIAWMHVKLTNAAAGDAPFAQGLRQSARYWLATEVPRIEHLAKLCESAESSYVEMQDDWF
ncbi:MAG: acyl-CoA dehydrogenase [Sandaracinaceae bacterium]|nr:acyl-CoA dehydrogenase [Sandaracinaceae bacterium]